MRVNAIRAARLRRGTALTEYALLLTAICCSVLFGARLILTSITWPSTTLLGQLDSSGQHERLAKDLPTIVLSDSEIAPANSGSTNTARQIGSLVVLFGCAVVASVALLRTLRRHSASDDGPAEAEALPERPIARFAQKRQEIFHVLSKNVRDLLSSNLSVGQIQTRSPVCVPISSPRGQLQEMMQESQFRHLLVCDSAGLLVGIISDRDFRTGSGATAAEIMTTRPYTIEATADIRTAITVLLSHRISALPVVEQNRPIGILTVTDLVLMLQATLQLLDKLHTALSEAESYEEESVEEELAIA